MLVHAVMNLSRRSSTVMPEQEKEERNKEKRMLMSSEVWDKAQKWVARLSWSSIFRCSVDLPHGVFFFSLLTRLGSHLKGGNGACSLKELQDLYDGFVTFLEVCTVVL